MSETPLSAAMGRALDAMGIPNERVQSGQIRGPHGFVRMARAGTPDRWTAYGWIEVKLPGKKLSAAQKSWHARARAHGVRVMVASDVGEMVAVMGVWRRSMGR